MKGIYITEEGKQEIEAKIAELEIIKKETRDIYVIGQIYMLKQIISSAIILPVEESWEHIDENTHTIPKVYPNGVIIQPKV